MQTKSSGSDKAKYDRLAALLKATSPDKLKSVLVKSESITIRLAAMDKAGMEQTAKACGLTITEYLTRMHVFASERLSR